MSDAPETWTDLFVRAERAIAEQRVDVTRVICPSSKGCLVGWLAQTLAGAAWVPEDRRFENAKNARLAAADSEGWPDGIVAVRDRKRPLLLDHAPDSLRFLSGACRHGYRWVELEEARSAFALCEPKLIARPPTR